MGTVLFIGEANARDQTEELQGHTQLRINRNGCNPQPSPRLSEHAHHTLPESSYGVRVNKPASRTHLFNTKSSISATQHTHGATER